MDNIHKIVEWENFHYLNLYSFWRDGSIPWMYQNFLYVIVPSDVTKRYSKLWTFDSMN